MMTSTPTSITTISSFFIIIIMITLCLSCFGNETKAFAFQPSSSSLLRIKYSSNNNNIEDLTTSGRKSKRIFCNNDILHNRLQQQQESSFIMMKHNTIMSAAATSSSSENNNDVDNKDTKTSTTSLDDVTKTKTPTKLTFDSFDYNSHWYPVVCSQDVPFNEPIRVTLFDIDYVLAKTTTSTSTTSSSSSKKDDTITYYAMIDSCPHKKVALSEGRITDCGSPNKKFIQCSYHGWTFDGSNGECVEIPQTMIAKNQESKTKQEQKNNTSKKKEVDIISNSKRRKRREDGIAVAVMEVQGIVWIQPNYTPLKAVAAVSQGTLQPPPRIPEIDLPGYKTTFAVRDFPIDWTVLMENIMDPDHGYFAHSSSGAAKGFDWYSADGKDNTVEVYEDFTVNEGKGWKITSSVNAVEKLIKYNREVRIGDDDDGDDATKKATKKKQQKGTPPPPKMATTTYVAPSLIYLCRRTPTITSPSAFITGFWICPTGTGKSRFMSAAISKAPFSIPRWLVHMNLNNFLDQDTFLLCGQHRAVLKSEAESYLVDHYNKDHGDDDDSSDDTTNNNNNHARKSTYVYRSPSERMPVRIGQFFDATLAKVPNRKEALLAWYNQNNSNNKLFESWPTREEVLDRYEQHTKICPNSMDVVKRCDKVMKRSKLLGFVLVFMKLLLAKSSGAGGSSLVQQTVTSSAAAGGFLSKIIVNPIRQLLSRSISFINTVLADCILQGKTFYLFLAIAFLTNYIASRIKREFYFKFDEDLHRKDIKYIAKNWIDL